ncbi:MAG TPA: amino acid adenylation domain-containing protein, partial [Longimicrobiaceae bacterium]|nr:amino acid adenylation domain-containing protein [Longimicrobiaceae bacterium]
HQDLPFEKLVDELHPVRDVTHTPVFQATFGLQNAPGGGPELPGLEISPVAPEGRTAKFDLSLAVVEGADGPYGVLEYATDLFDAATARRMAGHLRTLLAGLAADPDARLSQATLLDAAERRRVLAEWSGRAAPRPAAWVPVHERVLARAAEAPDAVALVCGGDRVTYGQLDARSAELAGRLRSRGVGPETRVAVLMERSPEGVVAALAVLRAGGAYLPLDPATPPERVERILEDAGVALVLDGRGVSEGPGGTGAGGGGRVSPDAAAYVIYTSGSTGTPKGVVVTHGGLANLVDWHVGAFGVTAADRATQLTGLGFDASVQETWPQLAAGATLHLVADEEARASAPALQRLMLEHAITLAFVPTPLAEGLLALQWPDGTALRVLLAGGDALRVRPSAGLPFRLVNAYGPTENTVVAATGVVLPDGGDARAPAIGRPIAGVRAYVLDLALAPVPAGVPGELCLGGRSVARGYLGRPGATAAAFVPDPFAGEAGARMYRTGDRVRWLEDGELEFLGRIDRQVKVRGFRIEPGEIEAVLARHPGVRGVAVVVRDGASGHPGDRRIVAYLEADGGVSPREARELARASLPEYMVPSAFVVLDALPLTPSGKLDRRALPAPEPSGAGEEAGAEPRTELEHAIAAVWEEVLGVPAVRTGASFFDLGGNSLLVVRAAERLEAALGRRVPVLDLFRHGTVAALARHLSGSGVGDPEPAPPADESRPSRLAAGKGRLHQLRRRRDAGG